MGLVAAFVSIVLSMHFGACRKYALSCLATSSHTALSCLGPIKGRQGSLTPLAGVGGGGGWRAMCPESPMTQMGVGVAKCQISVVVSSFFVLRLEESPSRDTARERESEQDR